MKKKGFTLIELFVIIAIIAMLLAIVMPVFKGCKNMIGEMIVTNQEISEMPEIFIISDGALWGVGDLGKAQVEPIIPSSKRIKYKVVVKNLPVGAELKKVGEEYFIIWQPQEQISQEISIVTDIDPGKDLVKKITLEAY